MTGTGPEPARRGRVRGLVPAVPLFVPAALLLAIQWLGAQDPVLLGRVLAALRSVADDALLLGAGAVLALVLAALLWPPLVPSLRLAAGALWSRMNLDRAAIRDLLGRIEHFASPRDLTELARHYIDGGQYREALPYLKRALEEGGADDARAHFEAARALFELGGQEQARLHVERALELEPELGFGAARLLATEIALAQRDALSAEAHARCSLSSSGPSVLGHFYLARALWLQGRRDEARAELRELLDAPKGLGRRGDARRDWARARAKLALRTGGRP